MEACEDDDDDDDDDDDYHYGLFISYYNLNVFDLC